GFDSGKVLDFVAEVAAQVLNEPVEQGGEVDRIPRGPPVVIRPGVGRTAVLPDSAVAVAGQGEEHRRPVGLAVRRGEDPAGRPGGDGPFRELGGVLAAPGGPGPALAALGSVSAGVAGDGAADSGAGELVVQFPDQLIEFGRVVTLGFGLVAADLCLGAQGEPVLLRLVGFGLAGAGLVLEVPAVAALLGAQVPGPLGAGRAGRFRVDPQGMICWSTCPVSRL